MNSFLGEQLQTFMQYFVMQFFIMLNRAMQESFATAEAAEDTSCDRSATPRTAGTHVPEVPPKAIEQEEEL